MPSQSLRSKQFFKDTQKFKTNSVVGVSVFVRACVTLCECVCVYVHACMCECMCVRYACTHLRCFVHVHANAFISECILFCFVSTIFC